MKRGDQLLFYLTHEYFLYAICAVIFVGTYYARAAVSLGTLALGVVGLLTLFLGRNLRAFISDKSTLAMTAIFFIYLLSGLYSSNLDLWQARVLTNLPYLSIPMGLWAFGPLSKRQMTRIVVMFIGVTCLSALILMSQYALNFHEYNAYYKVGKTIPTPIVHVRYSFFLGLAAALGLALIFDRDLLSSSGKKAIGVVTAVLIVCVDILAVRTGIFSLHGGILVLAGALVVRRKSWRLGVGIMAATGMLLLAGVKLWPSMKNKLGYMMWDLRMMTENGISPEYSDNIRIISISHGLRIFKEHPVLGVGIGDVADEMKKKYELLTPSVPPENRFFPISQYVFWLVAFGLAGTLILLFLWTYPLQQCGRRAYLIMAIYSVTMFSFFAETTIQLQYGKTIFLVLTLVLVQYYGRLEMRIDSALTAS